MIAHLCEKHHEYDGFVLRLATITYQTKKGITKSRHSDHVIVKSAKRPHPTDRQEGSAKAAKCDPLLSAIAALESAHKLTAQQAEVTAQQNERLMTIIKENTKTQATQAETWAKQAATQAGMVDLLAQNSLQGPTRQAASLESAVENYRIYEAFRQMHAGANNT